MVTRTRRRLFLGVALASSLASGACASVLGFERLSEDTSDAMSPEGGPPGTDAAPDTSAPCPELGVPVRPADGDPDGGHEILTAIDMLDFGIDSKSGVGYNLDRACSDTIPKGSCTTTVDETNFTRYGRDKDDKGTDNAGVALFDDIASVSSTIRPDEINERLREGQYGVLIRVQQWNGAPDDPDVRVEVFPTTGVTAPDGGKEPSFTSEDVWRRDQRFELFGGTNASKLKAVTAWVSGNHVVAFFDELIIPLVIPDDPKYFDVRLREVWVTATIETDGPLPRLTNGIIAGRWKTADFLTEVRAIFIKNTGPFRNVVVCDIQRELVYDNVKDPVCKGRDIRSASRDDNTGAACDSFSVGARFGTYAITDEGPFNTKPPVPARCVDAAIPANDDCQ